MDEIYYYWLWTVEALVKSKVGLIAITFFVPNLQRFAPEINIFMVLVLVAQEKHKQTHLYILCKILENIYIPKAVENGEQPRLEYVLKHDFRPTLQLQSIAWEKKKKKKKEEKAKLNDIIRRLTTTNQRNPSLLFFVSAFVQGWLIERFWGKGCLRGWVPPKSELIEKIWLNSDTLCST